ncbi:MAG: hypothetical protein JWO80_3569 [Bryobacterales bacterium]|nr:hypothetical protein [Bryobacterales bacterium]
MRRRTLIQSLFAWISLQRSRVWAQTASFPGKHDSTLKELAATVLPESLGRAATDAVALQFVRWVREYRAGAEMQTGYGFTRVRYKPGSPAPGYLAQLDRIASGVLSGSGMAARRAKIAEALQAANIKDLPLVPDGTHIAADLMAFYFQSPEANDLAYLAAIGKDKCRTLKNAGSVPAALKKGTSNAAL